MDDLLPVQYFHVVFTLPAQIIDIGYQNKETVYGLLFKATAQTLLTIAADPKHLGAKIGMTSVLHTWGSAMTHHLLPVRVMRGLRNISCTAAQSKLGRLFQTTLRRTRSRVGLSEPLHAPDRDLEPSPDWCRCQLRNLPLERLSHQKRG